MKYCSLIYACFVLQKAAAFVAVQPSAMISRTTTTTRLFERQQQQQFDLSKPVFDLFAARSIRGDALLRYNSLNQSEPLRINLFALLALSLCSFPFVSEAVAGSPAGPVQTGASIVSGIVFAGFGLRECKRRSNQLYRMEKELNSESLQLRLPMNVLSDAPFTDAATVGQLMRDTSNPPRIIAICGNSKQLSDALQELSILGRRLRQATTFVVPVPTDGSTRKDWNIGGATATTTPRLPWLADGYDVNNWLEYFDDLAPTNNGEFRWLGLNSGGRSFGSGVGAAPQWLQLMGQYLRPTSILDETDASIIIDSSSNEVKEILNAQAAFYKALTSGDKDSMMKSVFDNVPSQDVDEVIQGGGRIDGWDSCLAEGARPAGMKLSGSDAVVVSETEAYSTSVEFPDDVEGTMMTATLLAVQKWKRQDDDGVDGSSGTWKLVLHQTIPWTADTKAQGTLRCDCRGCVALTREPEKRTFGGIIG